MNAPVRLAAFVGVLVAIFLAAWSVGGATGIDPPGASSPDHAQGARHGG